MMILLSVLGLPHRAVDTRDVALYQVRTDYRSKMILFSNIIVHSAITAIPQYLAA